MRIRAGLTALLLQLSSAWALEIPPPPRDYVYDQTGTIQPATRDRLYQLLQSEDQRTGNQVLVAVFPALEGEDPVDFTNRLFKTWNPGQKGKDNGVVLAFYLQERKIRIEVGYGLESVLTDAISRRIIETEIVPEFKSGNLGLGIYNGAARTIQVIDATGAAPDTRGQKRGPAPSIPSSLVLIGFIVLIIFLRGLRRTTAYSSSGRSTHYRRGGDVLTGYLLGSILGGGGRNRSSGGGFGGGGFGGGGFGGGGGRSGGGGASGSW